MNLRNLAIWGVILLGLVAIYAAVSQNGGPLAPTKDGAAAANQQKIITYSELVNAVNAKSVKAVVVKGDQMQGEFQNNARFIVTTPIQNETLIENIRQSGAAVDVKTTRQSWWQALLIGILPILLLVGVWIFFMRQMQGGARGAMGFGKSKAKLLTEHKCRKMF